MPVPWPVIVSALPALVDTAARLFKKADTPPAPANPDSDIEEQLQSVRERLRYLESLEAEQAELLKRTLEQLQDATLALSASSRRANASLVVAAVAVLLALGALVMTLPAG